MIILNRWRGRRLRKMDDPNKEICKNCKYFQPSGDYYQENLNTKEKAQLGTCKRRSPTKEGWPETSVIDWCGDCELIIVYVTNCLRCDEPINTGNYCDSCAIEITGSKD